LFAEQRQVKGWLCASRLNRREERASGLMRRIDERAARGIG